MNSFKWDKSIYFLSIILPLLLSLVLSVVLLKDNSSDYLQHIDITYVLAFSIISVVLMVYAGLLIGSPVKKDLYNIKKFKIDGWNMTKILIVTYISHGKEATTVLRSIQYTKTVLDRMKVNYIIEIASDIKIPFQIGLFSNTYYYPIPIYYTTKNRSKYKSRALQYLVENRRNSAIFHKDAYILHMDEESVLTHEAVAGIHTFINKKANKFRIGQGEIKYNGQFYSKNLLTTAMDGMRTGSDLSRSRFQFKILHWPLFGMHGSFILVPIKIEDKVGFDFGKLGSLTEDAYFSLLAAEKGMAFGWVDGHIKEQSPYTLKDILIQRRRWLSGFMTLLQSKSLQRKTRLLFFINTLIWAISWVIPYILFLYLFLYLIWSKNQISFALFLMSFLSLACYSSIYLIGAYRNVMDTKFPLSKKVLLYSFTYLLIPISALLELIAIISGIIKPSKKFIIINK